MSIRGYLEPRTGVTARLFLQNGLADCGIRVEGAVLEGRISVQESQARDRVRGLSSDAVDRALSMGRGTVEQRGFWVTRSEK